MNQIIILRELHTFYALLYHLHYPFQILYCHQDLQQALQLSQHFLFLSKYKCWVLCIQKRGYTDTTIMIYNILQSSNISNGIHAHRDTYIKPKIPRLSSSSNFFRYWSSCCMCVSTCITIIDSFSLQNI